MLNVNVVVVAVAGFGANTPLTPAGAPSSASAMLPANPPDFEMVNVVVAWPPTVAVSAAGVAEIVYAGVDGAVTVNCTVAVCVVTPAAAALIVTAYEPTGVVLATTSVIVLVVSALGMGPGVKLAVASVGNPVAVNVTAPDAPFVRVIVTGTVTGVPCTAVAVPEPTEIVIAGVGTVIVYETV